MNKSKFMKFNEKELKVIENLSNAKGASGFEDEVLLVAKNELKNVVNFKEDKLRNLYLINKKNNGKRSLLMLDAHSDEVGFMVHSIRPNGTLRVVNLGGWNNINLPGSKVYVRNKDGKWLKGVFVSISKHYRKPHMPPMNDDIPISCLSIDIGATSYEEAKEVYKITIGEPIVPATQFDFDDKNGLMFGKAFDCRIGCAVLIEVMKRIAKLNLNIDVIGTLSSQEEVGERGVKVAVNNVKPDLAICLEGTPCDDTFFDPFSVQTMLKGGPMIRHIDSSTIASPRFVKYALNLAVAKHLLVQEAVREGGGNNAAMINTSLTGVSTITIGVPVRYIHAMNSITSYIDYAATVDLVIELIKNLNKKVVDSL